MQSQIGDILHPEQIKQIINTITTIDITEYGSKIWFKQDESLQQLNMQTHVNAIMRTDEMILDWCVTMDKLKVLIYDLVMTDIWKQKVLPLLKPNIQQLSTLKIYMCIYHEAVVCNLLEILMYYRTAVDESQECLIQIIDYAYSKLVKKVSYNFIQSKTANQKEALTAEQLHKQKVEEVLKRTPQQQFNRQIQDIQFSCCMMSISIIRYISDYLRFLEIGIIHHLVAECNIFGVLVPLIESKPWLRTNAKGEREKFQNNKWGVVEKSEYGRLPKVEAQIWITLYNLFMDPDSRKKYELTEEKKSLLLRLRKYMNEVLLDQIPNLTVMLRSLEQLSLMNVPSQPASNPFIVQVVPQMKTKISQNRNWKQIAEQQRKWLTEGSKEEMKEEVKRLADLYSHSTIEGLMEGFKCAKCTKEAFKRCSRCKKVWYCSKECQTTHWKQKHKAECQEAKKEEVSLKEQGQKDTSSLITEID